MRMQSRSIAFFLATSLGALAACSDGSAPTATGSDAGVTASLRAESQASDAATRSTSSVRWTRMAVQLYRARGGNAGRNNAYVTLAVYRAVLAANDARHGSDRPSPAGAAAAAAAVMLKQYYPLDVALVDATLAAQRAESPVAEERNKDFEAGEAIGRAIAAGVIAYSASDQFGLTSPGVAPVGPGFWVGTGGAPVRGGLGARSFNQIAASELISPPPPAFGSPEFQAALAEVRAFSDARTPAQVAITLKWVPFSSVVFNGVATDLLDKYHRSELESARVLAYANTAAFDAIIGCFTTKYTYWYRRPTEADPAITLATGLPNHPSYPSAHSCESGAFNGVLSDAFPSERASLDAIAQEASMSRVYGGLHYRFDGEAGLELGRKAARLALARRNID